MAENYKSPFEAVDGRIPIDLKFGMRQHLYSQGSSNNTKQGDLLLALYGSDTGNINGENGSLYWVAGNHSGYSLGIMPPSGVGMVYGLDYNDSPMYAMPTFDTSYSEESATILFHGIPTYEIRMDNNKPSQVGQKAAFYVTETAIQGATETQAGLIMAKNNQSFSGNKSFRGYSDNSLNFSRENYGGITLYNNLINDETDLDLLSPQLHFKWDEFDGPLGTLLFSSDGIFKFLITKDDNRGTIDANLKGTFIELDGNITLKESNAKGWSNSLFFKFDNQDDTTTTIGSWQMYSIIDSKTSQRTSQGIFRMQGNNMYVDIRLPSVNVSTLEKNTNYYLTYRDADDRSANKLIYFSSNSQEKISHGNHFIDNTKIAINSTSEPTENLYVNGLFGIRDEALDSGKARTVIYPSKQNPCSSSTCIIFNFGAVGAKRACIEITGHSYSHQLLHSVYEFYVGATNNWQYSGECLGRNTGDLVVYRENGNLKAYLSFAGNNSTVSIKIHTYASSSFSTEILYNQGIPTVNDQYSVTIKPRQVGHVYINTGILAGSLLTSNSNSTTTTPQYTTLELGNNTQQNETSGRAGNIKLYSTNAYHTNIKTRPSLTTTNSTFFLPAGDGSSDNCYAVWSPEEATAIGSTTLPVYVDAKGKVVACTEMSTLSGTGTQILASADLQTDKYLKVGSYYQGSSTTVRDTFKNCPVVTAFKMEVMAPISPTIDDETTGNYVYRIRKIIPFNTGIEYVQCVYTNGTPKAYTWGDWTISPQAIISVTKNGAGATLTKGGSTVPVYIGTNGRFTACDSYAGGTAITLNGTSKAASTASFYAPTSSGTAGYILKSRGANVAPSWIQSVPIANGGTGTTAITANRLLYVTSSKITASSHYINGTQIAINSTSAPTENLYVNGSAKVTGNTTLGDAMADTITINGKTILKSGVTYGTQNPEDIYTTTTTGSATTPIEGQIYFKIIS